MSGWRGSTATVAVAVAAALAFLALTTARIGVPGPQLDELHQAPAAFAHLGKRTEQFAVVRAGNYALMNMEYSGAIKSNLYGLALRLTRSGFDLVHWRLLGLGFVVAGVLGLGWLARSALPAPAMAVLCALLASDAALLLLSRFDFGPVCLALALRLLFVGLWLRGEADGAPAGANTFWLAAIVGFATFEKLNSWILVVPLAGILLANRARRSLGHVVLALAGLVAGALPLLAVNLLTFVRNGTLVSFRPLGWPRRAGLDWAAFGSAYSALGRGKGPARFFLDLEVAAGGDSTERWLLLATLSVAGAIALFLWRRDPFARLAGVALGTWLLMGAAMSWFPLPTRPHHWVVGTPFQYTAIAGALVAAWPAAGPASRRRRAASLTLLALALALVGARLAPLAAIQRAFLQGRTSAAFDPSFGALGRFAATQPEGVVFVATDWGVGTQIYSFSNGRQNFVHSLFTGYYGDNHRRDLRRLHGARVVYLVRRGPGVQPLAPEVTARIERDFEQDPWWREVETEPVTRSWTAVEVRKFVLAPAGAE